MAYENLICPSCACPLTLSSAQTQIACPRCFTWLELETQCNGVCLSCHAAEKTVNTASCADLSSKVAMSIEMSSAKKDSSPERTKNKAGLECLKALFKRVFNV
jgi:hypothetical protein